ncbi:hypothetical protein GCM10010317_047380 [Streptomyces mirabilis]|nr:hypothetical protein GCM10010317_047380 [Streptomyces mirabilis]
MVIDTSFPTDHSFGFSVTVFFRTGKTFVRPGKTFVRRAGPGAGARDQNPGPGRGIRGQGAAGAAQGQA